MNRIRRLPLLAGLVVLTALVAAYKLQQMTQRRAVKKTYRHALAAKRFNRQHHLKNEQRITAQRVKIHVRRNVRPAQQLAPDRRHAIVDGFAWPARGCNSWLALRRFPRRQRLHLPGEPQFPAKGALQFATGRSRQFAPPHQPDRDERQAKRLGHRHA